MLFVLADAQGTRDAPGWFWGVLIFACALALYFGAKRK
jgi:hypothetical protein